jgi:hypothetical protein
MIIDSDLSYSAASLRSFLIRHMEAQGYTCEWTLLSDVEVLLQAADLLNED